MSDEQKITTQTYESPWEPRLPGPSWFPRVVREWWLEHKIRRIFGHGQTPKGDYLLSAARDVVLSWENVCILDGDLHPSILIEQMSILKDAVERLDGRSIKGRISGLTLEDFR